jgi:hypothetical protein
MTIRQAFKILKQHSEWRAGKIGEQVPANDLTRALEIILVYLDNKINNSHANL